MKRDALLLITEAAQGLGLSTQARSREGTVFDATADIWSFRDGTVTVHIDFTRLTALPAELRYAAKRTMLLLVEKGSPRSLDSYFHALVDFMTFWEFGARQTPPVIRGVDYLNYRATKRGAKRASHLKTLLRKWHGLGVPGLEPELLSVLKRTKNKPHPKGVAVATMDPVKGPFTDIEFQAVQAALNDAYALGKIETSDFVLAWLFMALGSRPTQFAAMKVRDFHVRQVDGAIDYSIDVPRAKKKSKPTRGELRNRPLNRHVGELVGRYAEAVRTAFIDLLPDPLDAPMFPALSARKAWSAGFEHHPTPQSVGGRLTYAVSALRVQSERTGAAMRINAQRFRRTFGTRAAQEGHGVLVLAELLDHEDTQNVRVYVETRPDIAQRIDKAVALELAPIAQAFKGKLVRGEAEATRAGDPSSRIRDLRVSVEPLASCGQHSFCGLNAPLACYTCNSFEPWLDGPHEQLLDALLDKRSRQLTTTDQRIATVHDRTIFAVAQVVKLCKRQSEGDGR
jgi:integrase